jgi:gamma-glutamylcyclotransferase (GGCT)/AIG2-like uncharacterized protein YtfP
MSRKKKDTAPKVLVPLFVYGTLRKGFPLHEWMEDQKFVSEATLGGYSLISLGPYPALVKLDDMENYEVVGELYMVEEGRFEQLRKMEERVGYTTEDVEINTGGGFMNNTEAKAFVFTTLRHGKVKWTQTTVKGRQQMYPGSVVAA